MTERRDCVAGGAEIVVALEKLAGELSSAAVITVGQFQPSPGAVNVIAGAVELSIDFRDPDNGLLAVGETKIAELISQIATHRGLTAELTPSEALPAVALDGAICQRLQAAAATAGIPNIPTTISGALHDAAIVAPHLPTAMLFVASRDGISHNPAEYSRIEDFALAAEILAALVQELVTLTE